MTAEQGIEISYGKIFTRERMNGCMIKNGPQISAYFRITRSHVLTADPWDPTSRTTGSGMGLGLLICIFNKVLEPRVMLMLVYRLC